MNDSPIVVNHHADHPGFSGVTGAIFGVLFVALGRANAKVAIEATQVGPIDHVVDVGCGPGTAARMAARRGARVTAVDPSAEMLRVGRLVTPAAAGKNITWRPGTAEDVPVDDGTATVVWALATVHHWQDVVRALQQANRVLAPGGRLLAIERQVARGATGFASHGWTREQADAFATLCRDAGFGDVEVSERPRGRKSVWLVSAIKR
ncbi:class I SAM-dependent methyltransferase [Mycolicibacterium smegmatis]|uniref:class I SAM-dependent methyltransferase n=1 Tax=Mycolicibacterium smegmatis TaxID=1772 RepID=UPI0020A47C8C|nr:class I SAM-dependent methyltransferase [Mycolicibacterium smegmatis]MCP2626843.1 class I SAM-dependent methyltransferase [Mycolicibacterium smegmatis]